MFARGTLHRCDGVTLSARAIPPLEKQGSLRVRRLLIEHAFISNLDDGIQVKTSYHWTGKIIPKRIQGLPEELSLGTQKRGTTPFR